MVASGAPERTELHAENIADLALTMLEAADKITTLDGKGVDIRIGKIFNLQNLNFHFFFSKLKFHVASLL